MSNKNMTVKQLRQEQYKDRIRELPYINNWRKNPYTWLKARFYIEASSLLTYFLLRTNIKANTLSIFHGILGLVGGILLSIHRDTALLIAILIFFLRPILDWSDGYLARIRKETSITGAILDPYGTLLGALGLQIGLGLYVAQKSGMAVFYYLTLLIPLFYAVRLTLFGYNVLFHEYLRSERLRDYIDLRGSEDREKEKFGDVSNKTQEIVCNIVKNFLDGRARTVDFICLLLLFEIFTPIFITWAVFLGFVIKEFAICSGSFYIVAKGGWGEKKLDDKLKEIFRAFEDRK